MPVGGLEVRHAGGTVRVPAGRPFVIGRGPDADLDLPHPRVSRRHAVVEYTAEGWTLTDSSSNGTFLDDDRITVLRVDRPVAVRLGWGSGSTTVELLPAPGPPAGPQDFAPQGPAVRTPSARDTTVHIVTSSRLTIGRLPDNDVVVDD